MKTNVAVNIDTVECSVHGEVNQFLIPGVTMANLISPEGLLLNSYQNRTSISGKFGAHKIHARSLYSGRQLRLEGSPFAFLYGQNVFTSSEIKIGILKIIRRVSHVFDIHLTDEQKQRWVKGDIDLHRVDLAVNFKFSTEQECIAVLRQVRRQLEEQGSNTETSGTTVIWKPKDGEEYSISFYAKGPQMRQLTRYKNLPGSDRLLEECKHILRVEVRLRAPALRKLGLDKVSAWNDESALTAFSKYMCRLQLLSVTSGLVTAEELDALPSRLKPVLALHKAGCELEQLFSPVTLQRHRRDFKKIGLDLRCPNQAAGTAIPLTKVLSPKNAFKCAPAWMHDEGLVP